MIKERVIEVLENQKIGKENFYKKIGMTSASFRGDAKLSPLNSNAIENILAELPDLNAEWLLTGKGSMFKKEQPEATEIDPAYVANAIPYVSLNVVAGFGSADFRIEATDVKAYYVVPKFKDRKIDFMIEVAGSSMYPKYNSGDVIACKIIRESQFIQWNRVHVIATKEQGLVVKRIKENGEGSILAISDNKDYPPFAIPMDEITGIALVVGVIRLE